VFVAVSVNEYLRLSSSISPMDRAQAQRVKAAFERRNQKSTAVVAQLQRKLESYKQRLNEIESSRQFSAGSGGLAVGIGSPWPAFDLLKGIRSVGCYVVILWILAVFRKLPFYFQLCVLNIVFTSLRHTVSKLNVYRASYETRWKHLCSMYRGNHRVLEKNKTETDVELLKTL